MQLGHAIDWVVTLVPCTAAYALFFVRSFAHYAFRLHRRSEIPRGKKVVRIVIAMILWSLVGVLPIVADVSRVVDSEAELITSVSPDGDHRLVVTSTSPWAFGSHGITIYLSQQGGVEHQILSTRLANDGKTLYPGSNVRVTWIRDDRAEVWLAGEEQEPETITIEIRDGYVLVQTGSEMASVALSGTQASLRIIAKRLPSILFCAVPFALLLAWNLWLWRPGVR